MILIIISVLSALAKKSSTKSKDPKTQSVHFVMNGRQNIIQVATKKGKIYNGDFITEGTQLPKKDKKDKKNKKDKKDKKDSNESTEAPESTETPNIIINLPDSSNTEELLEIQYPTRLAITAGSAESSEEAQLPKEEELPTTAVTAPESEPEITTPEPEITTPKPVMPKLIMMPELGTFKIPEIIPTPSAPQETPKKENTTVPTPKPESTSQKAIEYPERLAIEYPERLAIEYPERLAIEYPERRAIEYPERPTIEFPGRPAIEYPERPAIEFPERRAIEYPRQKAITFPERLAIEFPEKVILPKMPFDILELPLVTPTVPEEQIPETPVATPQEIPQEEIIKKPVRQLETIPEEVEEEDSAIDISELFREEPEVEISESVESSYDEYWPEGPGGDIYPPRLETIYEGLPLGTKPEEETKEIKNAVTTIVPAVSILSDGQMEHTVFENAKAGKIVETVDIVIRKCSAILVAQLAKISNAQSQEELEAESAKMITTLHKLLLFVGRVRTSIEKCEEIIDSEMMTDVTDRINLFVKSIFVQQERLHEKFTRANNTVSQQ